MAEEFQGLWGGRFQKETDTLVRKFNDSLSFDKRLFFSDVEGSLAHSKMLSKQGIISEEDGKKIEEGLISIRDDVKSGKLLIEGDYEDIHSFVEAKLTERIGDAGKRLHTGRSRNDQVALDMRLFTRSEVVCVRGLLIELLDTILSIMKDNVETIMPGFTHLQKAQPITLSHHFGAYFEMFSRDCERLSSIYERMNYSPLGSGALAGTTYPLDRDMTAKELSFREPMRNSIDGVSDRDYLLEFLSALSIIMMHLSRLSEEIIIWNSDEYRFIELDDAYSTGSSIMPQKKNPDIAELVRGKTGRVYGAMMSLFTTMKAIPLAYDKDMQEDKEVFFDALDTVKDCIILTEGEIRTASFNKDRMKKSAGGGFTNATDAADYLVKKGVTFRDAHGIIGRIILYAIENKKALDELTIEEYKGFSDSFDEDIYEAIDLKNCVDQRKTIGAPGKEAMKKAIEQEEAFLSDAKKIQETLVGRSE